MKKPSPLLTIGLRYGALAAVLSIGLNIMMYYLGRHPVMISPFLDFRVFLYGVFIFFSLKEYRDFQNAGVLHFFQGMLGSFVVVATAAVLGSLIYRIFGAFEPNFVSDYVQLATDYIRSFPEEDLARIGGKEEVERNLAELPSTNMAQLAFLYLAQSFGIGLFISIILSVILRKQPKPE